LKTSGRNGVRRLKTAVQIKVEQLIPQFPLVIFVIFFVSTGLQKFPMDHWYKPLVWLLEEGGRQGTMKPPNPYKHEKSAPLGMEKRTSN